MPDRRGASCPLPIELGQLTLPEHPWFINHQGPELWVSRVLLGSYYVIGHVVELSL